MEFVFVVPRRELFGSYYPQGLVPFGPDFPRERFDAAVREHGFFVEREHAERTPDLKQVIPYSMAEVDGRILLMRRLARGGEKRLHQKLSIGVGGHINPEDLEGVDDRDPVRAGTLREIAEELDIRGETAIEAIGVLNDDSNAVGAVHVGLVQTLSVRGTVEIRERDVLEGRLVLPSELERLLEEGADFETWSQRLVERIHEWVRDPLTA